MDTVKIQALLIEAASQNAGTKSQSIRAAIQALIDALALIVEPK